MRSPTRNYHVVPDEPADVDGDDDSEDGPSSQRYRTQRRGGKGVRDIKTTECNGRVIGVASVKDEDEILMMTARGKLHAWPSRRSASSAATRKASAS